MAEFADVIASAGPGAARPAAGGGRTGRRAVDRCLREVVARVTRDDELLAHGLTVPPTGSVHGGAAGIAYALYRVAMRRDDPAVLAAAQLWADRAEQAGGAAAFYNDAAGLSEARVGRVSVYHARPGVQFVRALISHAAGDFDGAAGAAVAFLEAVRGVPDDGDLFLGSAGVLLAVTQLVETLPRGHRYFAADELLTLGASLYRALRARLAAPDCRGMEYLGIAHGRAGALYAALRWCAATVAAVPPEVIERLRELAACGIPDGAAVRWPLKQGRPDPQSQFTAGWCNGTAGHVHLWAAARRLLGVEFAGLAERAAVHTWQSSETQPHLCCGLAGRSYALLAAYKCTGDRAWVRRARELAARAAAGVRSPSYPWHSLYAGELGVALLGIDLADPERSAMPVFESEGWPPWGG